MQQVLSIVHMQMFTHLYLTIRFDFFSVWNAKYSKTLISFFMFYNSFDDQCKSPFFTHLLYEIYKHGKDAAYNIF